MPLSQRCGVRGWEMGACVNVAPEGLLGSGSTALGVGVARSVSPPLPGPC